MMELVPLGRTSLAVTRMGLGGNRLGGLPGTAERRQSIKLVEQALDGGVRLFDTADAYGSGTSETVLGDVLSGIADVVIATKVGYRFEDRSTVAGLGREIAVRVRGRGAAGYKAQDFSPGAIEAAVNASCRRLRRQSIDLLQLHGPPSAASTALPDVIVRLRAEGRIRAFGVGCESVAVAESWLDVDGLDCVQLPFGVLDPQAANNVLASARLRGIAVMVRGALGGGVLGRHLRHEPTGLDPVRAERLRRLDEVAARHRIDLGQLAVWFAMRPPAVDALLLGAGNSAQLADCLRWSTAPPHDPSVLGDIDAVLAGEGER